MQRSRRVWLLLLPFILVYAVLVVVPTLGVLVKSFATSHTLELELFRPSQLVSMEWTLENYQALFGTSYYLRTTINTLIISGAAVLVALLVGTPVAYLITRPNLRGKRALRWVISLPIYLSGVLASYALFLFFGRQGLFAVMTDALLGSPIQLVRTQTGVISGTAYIILPMFIRMAVSGFEVISSDVGEASLTLGANEFYTFRKVLLPLALPAIAAGTVVSFTYAMSLVVVVLVMGSGGATFSILPLEILSATRSVDMDIPMAAAMAMLLLVVAVLGQWLTERMMQQSRTGEVRTLA